MKNREAIFFQILPFAIWLLPYLAINSWNMPLASIVLVALLWKDRSRIFSANLLTLLLWIPLVGLLTWLISKTLIIWFMLGEHCTIHPWSGLIGWRHFFQVFNEEVILRAVLISLCLRWIQKTNARVTPMGLAWGLGVFFSLLHVPLYLWKSGDLVAPWALVTMAAFGFLCNWFYLRTHHIGIGFALHLGWNINRFAADYRCPPHPESFLIEGKSFALLEGHPMMALLCIGLAICVPIIDRGLLKNKP